jgi:DNA-binding beta-propeller fold protein YncE
MSISKDKYRNNSYLALMVVAGLCACGKTPPPAWNHPSVELVWPAPPDQARIKYQGLLRSADDLGRSKGVVDRLFGEKPTRMLRPTAVARSSQGTVVVADPGIPTLHFFHLGGRKYDRLGDSARSQLKVPVGLAIDKGNRVYVADSARGAILVYSAKRKLERTLGEAVLGRPTGVALSPQEDEIYVVDAKANRVVVLDLQGKLLRTWGKEGTKPGEFHTPTHIAVAPDGKLSVVDSLNYRIQVFQPDGSLVNTMGQHGDSPGSFTRPKGLAIDRFGRHYVVDAAFENVQIFAKDGSLLLAFGISGTGPGEFTLPNGIFLDSDNLLWVADAYNKRLQAFQVLGGAI